MQYRWQAARAVVQKHAAYSAAGSACVTPLARTALASTRRRGKPHKPSTDRAGEYTPARSLLAAAMGGKAPKKRAWGKAASIHLVRKKGEVTGYRVYQQTKYVGYHRSEAAARACIKTLKADGRSHGLGSTTRSAARPPVKFRGVVLRWSKRRNDWMYEGKVRKPGSDTKAYVGLGSSQQEVAGMIAKAIGTDVDGCKRKKCRRSTPAESMERCRKLLKMLPGWTPRDVTGAVRMRGSVAQMIVNAPGIYVGWLMGREHAWREALRHVWERTDCESRLGVMGMDSRDEQLRKQAGAIMHRVFRDAFQEYVRRADEAERDEWRTQVDRNVAYHLSLTSWGLREHILVKTTRARSIKLQNKDGEWYGLVEAGSEAIARMHRMHRKGRLLLDLPVPRTNKQWREVLTQVRQRAPVMKLGKAEDKDYHLWWLVRIYLIVEMRHAGIDRLSVVEDWSASQVSLAMLPDRSEWVQCWLRIAGDSLKTLLKKLSYREPLEMLSCCACILGDSSIDKFPTEALEAARTDIVLERERAKAKSAWSDEDHPGNIIEQVMAKLS